MHVLSSEAQIDILMATYNGEPYLTPQVESIKNQTYQNWQLLINDDGSEDATQHLIIDLAKHDNRIKKLKLKNSQKDAAGNFFALLAASKAPYVMFCDQDDIWDRDKIELEYTFMKELEQKSGANKPLLVFTDSTIVDKNLKVMNPSFASTLSFNAQTISLPQLLVANVAQGSTMLLNRKLADMMLSFQVPESIHMHDYWAFILCKLFGDSLFLPVSTMKYRQHCNNAIGAPNHQPTVLSGFQHALTEPDIITNWLNRLSQEEKFFCSRAQALVELFQNELDFKILRTLNNLASISASTRTKREKISLIKEYRLIKYQKNLYTQLCQFVGIVC